MKMIMFIHLSVEYRFIAYIFTIMRTNPVFICMLYFINLVDLVDAFFFVIINRYLMNKFHFENKTF